MSEKLKPCPFCGGKAEIKYSEWSDTGEPPGYHHVWSVGCARRSTRDHCCPGRLCINRGWKDMDEAVAAWNARAERTCEFKTVIDQDPSRRHRGNICECSECGFRCAWGLYLDEHVNYCPNCGARVRKEGLD